MKILPNYEEDEGAKCSSSISLRQNVGVLRVEDAQSISGYMESCTVIDQWLSNIRDPMTNQLSIPSKTWSDGVYVWDSSHIEYVKKYRVRLPEEFVEHVKLRLQTQFNVAALVKAELRAEFELTLNRLLNGDESVHASFKKVSADQG